MGSNVIGKTNFKKKYIIYIHLYMSIYIHAHTYTVDPLLSAVVGSQPHLFMDFSVEHIATLFTENAPICGIVHREIITVFSYYFRD